MSIFARKAGELEKVVADVEGEIGDLVSRDVAEPRRQPANDGETVASDLGLLLQRVSANSVQEIDWIINDLKMLRERLQREGERMADEIVAYASLSHAAMQSTKTISARLGEGFLIPPTTNE
jgi:hypothetical protein